MYFLENYLLRVIIHRFQIMQKVYTSLIGLIICKKNIEIGDGKQNSCLSLLQGVSTKADTEKLEVTENFKSGEKKAAKQRIDFQ